MHNDEVKKKPKIDNELCRVCGDPAAGFHFGVFTCEGCKSFFGRAHQKKLLADCKKKGKCTVNRTTRTKCKLCRLKKCFAVGMSKEASRYGRRSTYFKVHCMSDKVYSNGSSAMSRNNAPAARVEYDFNKPSSVSTVPLHVQTTPTSNNNYCNSSSPSHHCKKQQKNLGGDFPTWCAAESSPLVPSSTHCNAYYGGAGLLAVKAPSSVLGCLPLTTNANAFVAIPPCFENFCQQQQQKQEFEKGRTMKAQPSENRVEITRPVPVYPFPVTSSTASPSSNMLNLGSLLYASALLKYATITTSEHYHPLKITANNPLLEKTNYYFDGINHNDDKNNDISPTIGDAPRRHYFGIGDNNNHFFKGEEECVADNRCDDFNYFSSSPSSSSSRQRSQMRQQHNYCAVASTSASSGDLSPISPIITATRKGRTTTKSPPLFISQRGIIINCNGSSDGEQCQFVDQQQSDPLDLSFKNSGSSFNK